MQKTENMRLMQISEAIVPIFDKFGAYKLGFTYWPYKNNLTPGYYGHSGPWTIE